MKKLFCLILCVTLCATLLVACGDKKENENPTDIAYAYCCTEYDVEFGNYGYFSITVADGNFELETQFNDLSKFTLGGAFAGMEITGAVYDEIYDKINFAVKGELASGNIGTIEGEGIVKGRSVKVDIPISKAWASTDDILFDNSTEHQITVELFSACFEKDVSADDFALSGAAKDMTIKSVKTEYAVDENGEDVLSQVAILTLEGNTNGSDYAYIDILNDATTYNDTLRVTVNTMHRGAIIMSDHIDTFEGEDLIYIEARNITFKEGISAEDLTLMGALKDYAVIDKIDFVSESLIGVYLTFPYTFVDVYNNIGYIQFGADTNVEGLEFLCSSVVSAPRLQYTVTTEGNNVAMTLGLEHAMFNLIDTYSFEITDADGNKIHVNNLEIDNVDGELKVTFTMPDNCEGTYLFELSSAYDVVKSDGSVTSMTISVCFDK